MTQSGLFMGFNYPRNAFASDAWDSATKAYEVIQRAKKGDLKTSPSGDVKDEQYQDAKTLFGTVSGTPTAPSVTDLGTRYERAYQVDPIHAWRWLLTRSLWRFSMPNGSGMSYNSIATAENVDFNLFTTVCKVAWSLCVEDDPVLYYDDFFAVMIQPGALDLSSTEIVAALRDRPPVAVHRQLLEDLEPEYRTARDALNTVFGKALPQTGLFEEVKSGSARVGLQLVPLIEGNAALLDRLRFILANTVSWTDYVSKTNDPSWLSYQLPQTVDLPLNANEEEGIVGRHDDVDFAQAAIEFENSLRSSKRDFGEHHHRLALGFFAALAAKRFVILTGLSGSGKTQLARGLGQWFGEARYKVVPVRPDWTTPESILGFENLLSTTPDGDHYRWIEPDVLKFVRKAAANPSLPYLLILDEMNIAHVERYFADFLSGMESGEPILPDLETADNGFLHRRTGSTGLPLPRNLFVVGTVNVDETTYMFSPKVLDRASTIEFRVDSANLRGERLLDVALAEPGALAAFLDASTLQEPDAGTGQLEESLREVHKILSDAGREFGYRTFFECRLFAHHLGDAGEGPLDIIDLAVLQKVLPKLHGSRSELTGLLNELGEWCSSGPGTSPGTTFDAAEPPADRDAKLPLSFNKLHRMAKRLRDNHFVSFAE